MITALAGGVGAAKLLTGLSKIIKQEDLTVIVNTGDDIDLHGLHISPDIDIVTYTLAGIVDEQKGWGIRDDQFLCLQMLSKLGQETWFSLGDKDLATHIVRSMLLRQGKTLSEITSIICQALGLKIKVLPMTNDEFETRIVTSKGNIHFEEYLVKRQAEDEVLRVEFLGAETSNPAEGVVEALQNAELVVICPSNPIVSVGTILKVKGIREALVQTPARKVGVSPIVGGAPIKGPADKLLKSFGLDVSTYTVAKLYADFLDTFVIDFADGGEKDRIEELGVAVKVTNTVMRTEEDKVRLARTVLES